MLFLFGIIILLASLCQGSVPDNRVKFDVKNVAEELSGHAVPDFMIKIIRAHMKSTPFFQNATTDEEISAAVREILDWEQPEFIRKNYPYYLSGYTYEKNPVWVAEGGKFDINALVHGGPEMVKDAEKSFVQVVIAAMRSMADDTDPETFHNLNLLIDFEGMNLRKLNSREAMAFILDLIRKYTDVGNHMLDDILMVNVNFVVESVLNTFRPVLGSVLEKVETYGSNKAKWQAKLGRRLPKDALPEWYGGSKDFRPLAVYG